MKQKTIIVLGMHRSGTSALTNAIVNAGAYAGSEDKLIAADNNNELGYFERYDVININDELLIKNVFREYPKIKKYNCHKKNNDFEGLGWIFGAWLQNKIQAEGLEERIENYITNLISECPKNKDLIIKDPRMSLTFPIWKNKLHKPVIILMVRHPSAVANSLWERDKFSKTLSYTIWFNYMKMIMANIKGTPTYLVDYDQLIKDKEKTLRNVISWLNNNSFKLYLENIDAAIGAIKTNLNHSNQNNDDLGYDEVIEYYNKVIADAPEVVETDKLHQEKINLSSELDSALYVLARQSMNNREKELEQQLDIQKMKAFRVSNHPIAGRVIRLLQLLKKDKTFGDF